MFMERNADKFADLNELNRIQYRLRCLRRAQIERIQ